MKLFPQSFDQLFDGGFSAIESIQAIGTYTALPPREVAVMPLCESTFRSGMKSAAALSPLVVFREGRPTLHRQQYRRIMRQGCRQHEYMPHGVRIQVPVPQIKKYPYGI